MKFDTDISPFARVILLGNETVYPGWYIRYYVEGRLLTERLEISNEADAYEAVIEAAGYLGCPREQVHVESQATY
jgi:hypothetical protein